MGVLTVGSSNPQFSYIIQKNPNTIRESKKPFTKEIRKGAAYGWFTKGDQEFRLWFRDNDLETSFGNGMQSEFEYLDTSRYGSPYLPIALISNCLASAAKKLDENDVDGFEAYATTAMKVPRISFLEHLAQHYAGIAEITSDHIYGSFYKVTVKAPKVHTVLNVMQVLCLMMCFGDEDTYVRLDQTAVEKYINCLNAANAPYFVRYLFSTHAIHNRAVFERLKDKLQGPGMDLRYGNTRQQRYDALTRVLKGGKTLIDIGCGEMFYSLRLAQRYEEVYAIDADPEIAEINGKKLANRRVENVVSVPAKVDAAWVEENQNLLEGADVLLTEVVEHMPLEEAKALIAALVKTDARMILITTPNKDFNKHYGFSETDTRHDDHHWEVPFRDFMDVMSKVTVENSTHHDCIGTTIGDAIDGVGTTSAAVIANTKYFNASQEGALIEDIVGVTDKAFTPLPSGIVLGAMPPSEPAPAATPELEPAA